MESRGSNVVVIFMVERASGGRMARRRRGVFERGEKGLKVRLREVR